MTSNTKLHQIQYYIKYNITSNTILHQTQFTSNTILHHALQVMLILNCLLVQQAVIFNSKQLGYNTLQGFRLQKTRLAKHNNYQKK